MVESHCTLQKIVLLEHEKCGNAATLLATSLYHKLGHKQNAEAVFVGCEYQWDIQGMESRRLSIPWISH